MHASVCCVCAYRARSPYKRGHAIRSLKQMTSLAPFFKGPGSLPAIHRSLRTSRSVRATMRAGARPSAFASLKSVVIVG